jgi:hypothetical protein
MWTTAPDIVTAATTWTDIRVSEVGVTSNVMGFGAKATEHGRHGGDSASDRRVASPNHVRLPTATCKITDTLLIANHRTSLEGNGSDASWLHSAPTVDGKAAIKVDLATATDLR